MVALFDRILQSSLHAFASSSHARFFPVGSIEIGAVLAIVWVLALGNPPKWSSVSVTPGTCQIPFP